MYDKFEKPSVECLCPGGCGRTIVFDWSTSIRILDARGNIREEFKGVSTCDECRIYIDTKMSIPACQFELLFGGES